jgi:nitrate/nitrite-specific signal transduction histidine kinase
MQTADPSALDAALQQLEYWKQQRDIAARQARPERLAQCEKFVAQCELVVSALCESTRERGDRPVDP